MPDALTVRPLTSANMPRFLEVDNIAFLEGPSSEEAIEWQLRYLEQDRTIGLFDGDTQVGGASICTLRLTVPEARQVPIAGVTWVSVLPTHRRRGGLRAMMRQQLHTLHETGAEPVAGLTASEAPIYGRFGYGIGTRALGLAIPRHANALRLPEGVDDVRVSFVEPKSVIEACKELYERQVLTRPGMFEKPDWWYEYDVADLAEMRGGMSNIRYLLAARDGAPVGYASYRTKAGGESDGEVRVRAAYADDPAAYAALLRVILNIDLASTVVIESLQQDSPLVSMLEDLRAAKPTLQDGLFVRLVDLDRALAARSYTTPVDVVLDVVDEFCPWNAGRWRLSGDENGAVCARTEDPADLTVGVRELGSIYLGGITLRGLAFGGLVREHTPGAVRAVSRAFASDVAPFLPLGM
jgi:predicted acetyltransferase